MATEVRVRPLFKTALFIALFSSLCISGFAQPSGIGGPRDVNVATVNLYVGADVSPLTALDPTDVNFQAKLIAAVATLHAEILASNFPKRAEALAQQIVDRAPDVVALQEVSLLRRQSPGDFIFGGTVPATQVELDYLAILLDALNRRGAHYGVVAQDQNSDVELPLLTAPMKFDDIRLTDRDVILARTDLPPGQLKVLNPQQANYTAHVPLPLGFNILRGWCSVDVFLRGRSFRVIDTHLEEETPAPLPNIQGFQAAELLAGPAYTSLPVILAGDFNSDAYGKYGPVPYQLAISQGFSDAWSVARPRELGLTWGHDAFLANPAIPFVFRLDFVLYRGKGFQAKDADLADPMLALPPPLWLSDHAALFADLAVN